MNPEGLALVTGAGRGIGRAVAVELARRGFSVIAGVRTPIDDDALTAEVVGGKGTIRTEILDITRADRFEFPEEVRVLVNNAGTRIQNYPVEHASMEEWRAVFETNVFGTIDVTRRAIPALRRRGGVICNITTSSLLVPLPFFGTYRASKAAISALSETLRVELAPLGIRVVEILPGPIDTQLHAASVMYRVPEAASFEPYRPVAEHCFPATKFLSDSLLTSPAVAAEAIVEAILDDEAPMRHGCDPMSVASLEGWRRQDDESAMVDAMSQFSVPPPNRHPPENAEV